MNEQPQSYYRRLLSYAQEKRSVSYKLLSLAVGIIIFLIILPAVFLAIAYPVHRVIGLHWPGILEAVVAVLCIPLGLCILLWSTLTQWKAGGGTPAQTAPTQRLVTSGPYAYCRNPIELGAIIYYLGLGTAVGSFNHGLILCLLGFITGTAYHKLVEERELELRFGQEYAVYRARTPFLFPRLRRPSS